LEQKALQNNMRDPKVSFFTPGHRLPYDDSYIIVDQSYVHFRPAVPNADSQSRPPLLFVHGGGLTGAMWEATPDLRPGWAVLASETGYASYILDTTDNGRSARAPDSIRSGEVEHRTAKQVWSRFRLGPVEKYGERELFEGSQFPIDSYDALLASQSARRRENDEVERRGLVEAIKMIGPCWVIAHSHGAALMIDVLSEVKDLVEQMVLVEPGGTSIASKLIHRLRTLVVWGDYLNAYKAWPLIAEPFERAPVEIVHLPEVGLPGNSHFPMIDLNSQQVFKQILVWLEKS
jgi:pimeloyl-ACP methyl ester carboxylesterase